MRQKIRIFVYVISIFLLLSKNCLSQIDVYVDPGHGGSASGTVNSNYPDALEKFINLAIAEKFVDSLEYFGDTYVMSRDIDAFVFNTDRAYEAIDLDAQAFISIHHNVDWLHVNKNI